MTIPLALTILILIPLVGAVVTAFLPHDTARLVGIGVSVLALAWALLFVTLPYQVGGGMQLTEEVPWIEPFGVHYALGVDGLGLVMVLLTTFLVPVVFAAAWPDADEGGPRGFTAWTLGLEAMSLAVFLATDVFLFYIAFEATLVPAYFLIGGYGTKGRGRAALKFLLYQLAGGLIMLFSVIGLYVVSADAGHPTYLLTDLAELSMDPTVEKWLFAGFFAALAIKAPLFPVHTWLADTTEKASPGVSVLLVCILDKIGTFGMLRICLGLFPNASQWATPVVVVLALISIIYGAFLAIGQDDLLRLIGLTSLSHFGFITLGIFVFTQEGAAGSVLYMVNHGLSTAALFIVAGYLVRRRGSASISSMAGVEKPAPLLAGLFLFAGLATLGLPGLAPFVSEFLVIMAALDHAWWAGAVAVVAIVLAAIYVLWPYQRMMTGPTPPEIAGWKDLDKREIGALVPLVVALVFFGFYPAPLLDAINPTVQETLVQVGHVDDGPVVAIGDRAAQEGQH